MKESFLFLSICLLAAFDSNAQPEFLNQTVLSHNTWLGYFADPKAKKADNEGIIIENGVNEAFTKTIQIKIHTLDLPHFFLQEKRQGKEIGGTQPAAISNRLLDESKSLFEKFVTSISFFHFLIDKEVVKKNKPVIQPPGLKFNSSFEIQALQARQ